MKFAHFSHVWGKAGLSPAQRYEQLWKELEAADATGFDYGFCVEHHFSPRESWMTSPSLYTVAAGARTKRIRLGGMGHVAPLHHPVRLVEEITMADQMLGGRVEVGLVAGIVNSYFTPFAADFANRRDLVQEFIGFLKTAYGADGAFDFHGATIQQKGLTLSIPGAQRPHPPLWLESRDIPTLEFCAQEGLNTGYFIFFPRAEAKPRYETYLANWRRHGWTGTPNIAYSTVVYVDETDEKALSIALADASRAYKGIFTDSDDPDEIRASQNRFGAFFESRGEPGAAEIVRHMLDPDYLLEKELILIGSPDTVAKKLRRWASDGMFNTFFGEFNFGNLPEDCLLRSINLFGREVIPALRDFEPF